MKLAEVQDLLNQMFLLIDLNRVNAAIDAGVLRFFHCAGKTAVEQLNTGFNDIRETQQDR